MALRASFARPSVVVALRTCRRVRKGTARSRAAPLLRRCRAGIVFLVSAGCIGVAGAEAADPAALDAAVFDAEFCTSPSAFGEDSPAEINTGSMSCAMLMELVYATRLKVSQHLDHLRASANATDVAESWIQDLGAASKAFSLLGAHAHIIAAVASQRAECFSEHVRMLLTVGLRRLKGLTTAQVKQLWKVAQDGPSAAAAVHEDLVALLQEAGDLVEADLRTLRAVLRTWREPTHEEARFYSHEEDGRYSTMEALRRDTFEEFQLDKGLLRGLLRHVFPTDSVIGDFGAGAGHYSKWLNDTGLLTSHAFDGSPDVELVTKGVVRSADLGRPLDLGRKFDWVLCIEVAEHIPAELSGVFLKNLDGHVSDGLVLSWARPGLQGMGSANPRSEHEVLELIRQYTGLHFNAQLTAQMRAVATAPPLAETLLVLVRDANTPGVAVAVQDDTVAPGCVPEEGWIYAGNDVQMFSAVESAEACCDLCSSNELCRFWTWSREDSHKDLCWIKSTREYRINHNGFVSGARRMST